VALALAVHDTGLRYISGGGSESNGVLTILGIQRIHVHNADYRSGRIYWMAILRETWHDERLFGITRMESD